MNTRTSMNRQIGMSKQKILLVYKSRNCTNCNKVALILRKNGFLFDIKIRSRLTNKDFKIPRVVIVVGGDGTILRVCQHVRNNSVLLGIKNDEKTTEGFLTRATTKTFIRKLRSYNQGKGILRTYLRIQVRINKKLLHDLALNEVSISSKKPYLTQAYQLGKVIFKATGILIATPLGSTAWARSAGGEVMSLESSRLQYVIREPYVGNIYLLKKRLGFVHSYSVKVRSDGIVVFDSLDKEYPFKKGDIITVLRSKQNITFIE